MERDLCSHRTRNVEINVRSCLFHLTFRNLSLDSSFNRVETNLSEEDFVGIRASLCLNRRNRSEDWSWPYDVNVTEKFRYFSLMRKCYSKKERILQVSDRYRILQHFIRNSYDT